MLDVRPFCEGGNLLEAGGPKFLQRLCSVHNNNRVVCDGGHNALKLSRMRQQPPPRGIHVLACEQAKGGGVEERECGKWREEEEKE